MPHIGQYDVLDKKSAPCPEPAYLVDLRRGGYCVRDDLPYARAPALLAQTEAYFAQPTARKLGDTIEHDADHFDGYGSFGAHKEMLFLRTRDMPPSVAPEAQAFWQWAHALALRLLGDIAEECGFAPQHLYHLVTTETDPPREAGTSMLRLFHYRAPGGGDIAPPPEGNAHHDLGILAIGLRTAPGLEAQLPGTSGWQDIEANVPAQAAVIMVGRTLATVTGNRYPSCYHRITYGDGSRFSAVYQIRVREDARLFAPYFANRHPDALVASFNLTGAQLHHFFEVHCPSINQRDAASRHAPKAA